MSTVTDREAGIGTIEPGPSRQIRARSDEPTRTELAIEKVAGLLALATGVGLLGPLLFAVQQGDADGVGAAVVAVLSAVTILAGSVLLRGHHAGADEEDDPRRVD